MTGNLMDDSALRAHVRRRLSAHLAALGFTDARGDRASADRPELVRMNPVRGRIAYGETVLSGDLGLPLCHRRLVSFSRRRTRGRRSILFFIGVVESERRDVEGLLRKLGIHNGLGGGHVQVVPVAVPEDGEV